jgi:hypothetical protein
MKRKITTSCVIYSIITLLILSCQHILPCEDLNFHITSTHTDISNNQNNGTISLTAAGGTDFTYSLNGGTPINNGEFTNLAPGSYIITGKNSSGCTDLDTVVIGGTIDPCAGVNIVVNLNKTDATGGQNNGTITATASGGGNVYTYSKDGINFQASGTFSNLAPGTYTITAKNSNGCTGTSQQTINNTTSPCTGITINITTTPSNVTPCLSPAANGSITVSAAGSTGFTYNNNGGAYQSSNVFSGLAAGNYIIGVKDINGCSNTQSVTVETNGMGPNFTNVRTIIRANCGNCHLNGGNTAGYNFDNDCSIVNYWSQINKSCVTYQLRQMPPSYQLTATQKAQITSWVNAGHRYTD